MRSTVLSLPLLLVFPDVVGSGYDPLEAKVGPLGLQVSLRIHQHILSLSLSLHTHTHMYMYVYILFHILLKVIYCNTILQMLYVS
jgi:hypothetical protein